MDKYIILEALDFAVRKSQIDLMLDGKSDFLINEYCKFKSTYKKLRIRNECDLRISLKALILFKQHLELLINIKNEFKDFILKKIDKIQIQINLIN